MDIRVDNLQNPLVVALLGAHLVDMAEHSPPESVHALDLEALKAPNVTFWTAWQADVLLGCGALQETSLSEGEIKSMRTSPKHLRKGVAANILERLIEEARKRNYSCVNLETGSADAFKAARLLYERYGFEYCEPFNNYTKDSHSLFMQLTL